MNRTAELIAAMGEASILEKLAEECGELTAAALKLNGVDSRLVLFHGESHGLSRTGKPKNRIRRLTERRQHDEITADENFMVAVERKDSGEMIGEIVVMPNDGCFSIGYTFHYNHHRKGYAFEALSALTDLLHEQYPDMEFISFTEPENTASMNLLMKLGYSDLGYEPKVESQVFGKWLKDEDWQ